MNMPTDIPDEILVKNKVQVFISSCIGECVDERAKARDAVFSINQQPILFEDLGARPPCSSRSLPGSSASI